MTDNKELEELALNFINKCWKAEKYYQQGTYKAYAESLSYLNEAIDIVETRNIKSELNDSSIAATYKRRADIRYEILKNHEDNISKERYDGEHAKIAEDQDKAKELRGYIYPQKPKKQ